MAVICEPEPFSLIKRKDWSASGVRSGRAIAQAENNLDPAAHSARTSISACLVSFRSRLIRCETRTVSPSMTCTKCPSGCARHPVRFSLVLFFIDVRNILSSSSRLSGCRVERLRYTVLVNDCGTIHLESDELLIHQRANRAEVHLLDFSAIRVDGGAMENRYPAGRNARFPPLADPRWVRFRPMDRMSAFRLAGDDRSRPLADFLKVRSMYGRGKVPATSWPRRERRILQAPRECDTLI